jgi:NitT/TauT family transport system substrate-binding protein
MNARGIVLSGDVLNDGIGAMTDEHWRSFYQSMVDVEALPKGLDVGATHTLDFVNKGIGKP